MDKCCEKDIKQVAAIFSSKERFGTRILLDGKKQKKHICKTTENILFSDFKI